MEKLLSLPHPIEHYLRTVNAGDAEGFARSFAADAVVEDVQRTIRGLPEIEAWARREIFAVHAHFDVIDVTHLEERIMVTMKVDGDFDKTGLPNPLLMDHAFAIANDKITELKISFTTGD